MHGYHLDPTVPNVLSGTTAARPAAGVVGCLYYNTTTGTLQRDNGTDWADVGGGGGGTPSDTVSAETSYGVASAAGAASAYSRGDHTHGSPSLGTTGTTACAGNDSRLSDSRTPTAHAGTHNSGGSDALAIDSASATGSLRTLGTGANQACAGNDSRLSDARTPTSHATSHNAGGGDALAIDAAAGSGSLRTLGSGATQAAAGNHTHGSSVSRSIIGPWTKVNVPASGSDLTFDLPTSAILPTGQARIRMPFAGTVVGIMATMSAARTGGTATFEVFKNNAALTGTPTCVINATDTQRAYGAGGTGTFVAGDDIDVRVDMAGTYAPTTSEAAVYVVVEWS